MRLLKNEKLRKNWQSELKNVKVTIVFSVFMHCFRFLGPFWYTFMPQNFQLEQSANA